MIEKNITVTNDHIKRTIEEELARAIHRAADDTEAVVAAKSYCSSCPVANAVDAEFAGTDGLLYLDVDGVTCNLGFGTSPAYPDTASWMMAVLPGWVQDWIDTFDAWLKPATATSATAPEEVQTLLDHPETWPAPPATFTLTFNEED